MKLLLILLFNVTVSAQAKKDIQIKDTIAPKIKNIKWISGNCKGETFGGQTEENWRNYLEAL
jgi:hypothetical protein